MFQNLPRPQTGQETNAQRDEQQKRDKQAQDAVAEAQRRMLSDAQQRSVDLQRQTIDGRVEDVRAKERQGASAQQVADKAKENTLGNLDFDLSRLSPPSINEDKRGEIRVAYMRAIEARAKEIEVKQVEQHEKDTAERERRDRNPSLTS